MPIPGPKQSQAVVFAVGIALAACSPEPGPAAVDDANLGESRFGLIAVNYEHDWADSSSDLRLKARAQFVHYMEMDREHVARLLGLPLDPARDLPAEDTCKIYDLTLDPGQDLDQEESGHVELLEAGDLRVQTPGGEVTLRPRHLPGLLPFISGVVYAEATSLVDQRLESVVAVASDGGETVAAFKAQATSPQLPRLLRVSGSGPTAVVQAKQAANLSLRWRPGDDEGDIIYLELRYSKGERELALRCQPRDDGVFEIPEALVTQAASGDRTLEIVRLRQSFFGAAGLDRGELRVTVRERASIQLP